LHFFKEEPVLRAHSFCCSSKWRERLSALGCTRKYRAALIGHGRHSESDRKPVAFPSSRPWSSLEEPFRAWSVVSGLWFCGLWPVACGLSLWALVSISTSPVSHTGGTTVQLPASITLPIPADINSCAGGEHLARHTAPRAPRGHSQLLYLSSSRCIITPPSAHLLSPLPPLL
jgi:hypothetical protein